MNNVIPLHRPINGSYEVVVSQPSSYKIMLQVVQALRDNKVVILKLENLDRQQAQRLLDFVSGSTYAISGHPSKVGSGVFLFTPYSIQIQASRSG